MADKCIPIAKIRRAWLNTELSSSDAAASVGLSRSRLWVRAKALGLPPRKVGLALPVLPDDFDDLWHAGVAGPELAALVGMSRPNLTYHARRRGLPKRPTGTRGISLATYRLQQAERADKAIRLQRAIPIIVEAENA